MQCRDGKRAVVACGAYGGAWRGLAPYARRVFSIALEGDMCPRTALFWGLVLLVSQMKGQRVARLGNAGFAIDSQIMFRGLGPSIPVFSGCLLTKTTNLFLNIRP
jgi:hypothetical protein